MMIRAPPIFIMLLGRKVTVMKLVKKSTNKKSAEKLRQIFCLAGYYEKDAGRLMQKHSKLFNINI